MKFFRPSVISISLVSCVALSGCAEGDSDGPNSGILKVNGVNFENASSVSMPLGGATDATCGDIIGCIELCNSDDVTCILTCFSEGSKASQDAVLDLQTCTEGAAAGSCSSKCLYLFSNACVACVSDSCAGEISTCFDAPAPPPTPDAGMPAADSSIPVAIDSSTPDPLDSGIVPDTRVYPPSGSMNCYDLYVCLANCAPTDQQCLQGCADGSSASAITAYMNMSNCADTAANGVCYSDCSWVDNPDCQTCLKNQCSAEIDGCLYDGVSVVPDAGPPPADSGTPTPPDAGVPPSIDQGIPPSTSSDCKELTSCLLACGTTPTNTCMEGCAASSQGSALQDLTNLGFCAQNSCMNDCSALPLSGTCLTCLEQSCNADYVKCLAGP
jgi:hypothetical protein